MTGVTWTDLPISEHHVEILERSAVTPEIAQRQGVRSVSTPGELPEAFAWVGEHHADALPGLVFPWRTPSGRQLDQLRLDQPFMLPGETRPAKYLWPRECGSPIGVVREDEDGPVVFVEGTKQALAAAAVITSGAVYAIAGCRSWSSEGVPESDLDVADARPVVCIFDADVETNLDVWEAARKFGRALEAEGADDVRYVLLPAGGKAGLDDVLGGRAPEKRKAYLDRLLSGAVAKLPAKPKKKAAEPVNLGSADRPPIAVNDDRLNVINNITGCLRRRWDGSELFAFGGVLAQRRGGTMLPVVPARFVDLVQQVATTVNVDDQDRMTFAEPTGTTMSAALSRVEEYTQLDRLATVPFVRPDGTVCATEGYDEATHTFLVDPLEVTVPDDPSEEDIRSAVKLLTDDWLSDLWAAMPSPSDKANALALILTPLIRGLVPIVPLAVVNGLQMGVGKNLVGDCLSIFATGSTVVPLPYNASDEENRKVILSTFRQGRELFVFDEAHVVEGAAFARAITASTYTDRVLGVSTQAEFPNNVTWVSLGNNVQINGDMSRRVYVIRLAPAGANPQDRSADSFRHPDLRGWTIEHRAELVSAGLTLVRAWFAAGRPQSKDGRRFGSFEAWGGMVGGVLELAGIEGFLGNLQEWRSESDYTTRYWVDHLGWLAARWAEGEAFTVSDVHAAMRKAPSSVEHPPGLEDHEATGYGRSLGQAYGKVKGRTYGALRLQLLNASAGHGNRWTIEREGKEGGDTALRVDEGGSGGIPTLHIREKMPTRSGGAHVPASGEQGKADPPGSPRINPKDGIVTASARTWTPEPDPKHGPAEHLLALADPPPADTCAICEGPRELVPPALFWLACRSCHPATFARVASAG